MKGLLYILKKLNIKERFIIVVCFFLTCLQIFFELQLPYCMAVITEVIMGSDSVFADVKPICIQMVLYAVGAAVVRSVIGGLSCYVGINFSKRLSQNLYEKIEKFSGEDTDRFATSGLITRLTSDVEQIRNIFTNLIGFFFRAPLVTIFGLWRISGSVVWWTMSMWIAIVIVCVTIILTLLCVTPKFKEIQELNDKVNHSVRETIDGTAYIRGYNAQEYQKEKFSKLDEKITTTYSKINYLMQSLDPALLFLMNILSLAIYWIGAYVIDGAPDSDKIRFFSDMVFFSSYAMQIITGFLLIALIVISSPRAIVSCNRIVEIMNCDLKIKEGTLANMPHHGKIVFDNVSFKYYGMKQNAITDISFSIDTGQTLGIIGPTGSGKTTLLNLIMRFYDATSGNIFIDGIDIKKYRFDALYSCFGYVPQKAVLFSGTIRENIMYGVTSANKDDMRKAAEAAQIAKFINSTENGYETQVSQNGSNFSGGQKQRIAIARALQRNPSILLLDDSFSALDYITEKNLTDALNNYKNMTKVIVSQKISTIRNADTIIVMDEGKCVGIGNHDELMQSCELYSHIAYSQFIEKH